MNVVDLVKQAGARLGKGEAFTVVTFIALTYLLVVGLVKNEPVGGYIAAVATAFIGGGAAKVWADRPNGVPK